MPQKKNTIEVNIPEFLKKANENVLCLKENLATDSGILARNIFTKLQDNQHSKMSLKQTIPIARKHSILVDIDDDNITFCQSVVEKQRF